MTGAGSLLRLIRNGEAVTRADLVRRTGLARSTVAQRVDAFSDCVDRVLDELARRLDDFVDGREDGVDKERRQTERR